MPLNSTTKTFNIETTRIEDLTEEEKLTIEDNIVLSERYCRMLAMCVPALNLLRSHNMFNKTTKEIREFFIEQGHSDWNEEWFAKWHTPITYEIIKKKFVPNYYTSKYIVPDPVTKTTSKYDTLQDALKAQADNKTKYLNLIKELFIRGDQFFDIVNNCLCDSLETVESNYLQYHSKLFVITEEMTTFNGHVIYKKLT